MDLCFLFAEICVVKEKKNVGKVVNFENQVTQIGDSAMMMMIDTTVTKSNHRFGLHGGENDEHQQNQRSYFDHEDKDEIYPDLSSSDTFGSQDSDWRDTGREISLFDCLSTSTTMDNATALSNTDEDEELYKMRLKTHQYQSELHFSDSSTRGSLSPFQQHRHAQNDEKSALPSLGERVGESYEQYNSDTTIEKGTLPSILEIVENIFSPTKDIHDVEYSITSSDSDSPSNHSTSHNNTTSLWVSSPLTFKRSSIYWTFSNFFCALFNTNLVIYDGMRRKIWQSCHR